MQPKHCVCASRFPLLFCGLVRVSVRHIILDYFTFVTVINNDDSRVPMKLPYKIFAMYYVNSVLTNDKTATKQSTTKPGNVRYFQISSSMWCYEFGYGSFV